MKFAAMPPREPWNAGRSAVVCPRMWFGKILGWAATFFGGILLVITVAMILTAKPRDPELFPPDKTDETVPVYVTLSYRWMHAQLVLPHEVIAEHGGPAAMALASLSEQPADWVSIGFGDEAYYRERGMTDARLADFARSMLMPDNAAVIELDPTSEAPTPANTGKSVLRLQLSQSGARKLVEVLDASFALQDGTVRAVGRGRDPGSEFFLSRETSDLFHNCNHWIAGLLAQAGVPVTPVLDTVSTGFALDLRLRANAQPVSGNTEEFIADRETPPTHSGRFLFVDGDHALANPGELSFQGYTVRLGSSVVLETEPVGLVDAGTFYSEDRDFQTLFNVPSKRLVGIRHIRSVTATTDTGFEICDGARPTHLAFSFRSREGVYEIELAVFGQKPGPRLAGQAVCATGRYVQP